MNDDFYEDDEPVGKIKRAFTTSKERGITAPEKRGINRYLEVGTTYVGERYVTTGSTRH